MNIDWPFAIGLAVVFVVMSYVRWRWFRARMRRIPKQQSAREPERSADDDSTAGTDDRSRSSRNG